MKTPRLFSQVVSRSILCVLCASAAIPSAFAQSCAMCYKSAAQSGPATTRALVHGILVLLIPTLSFFIGVLVFTIRRAKSSE